MADPRNPSYSTGNYHHPSQNFGLGKSGPPLLKHVGADGLSAGSVAPGSPMKPGMGDGPSCWMLPAGQGLIPNGQPPIPAPGPGMRPSVQSPSTRPPAEPGVDMRPVGTNMKPPVVAGLGPIVNSSHAGPPWDSVPQSVAQLPTSTATKMFHSSGSQGAVPSTSVSGMRPQRGPQGCPPGPPGPAYRMPSSPAVPSGSFQPHPPVSVGPSQGPPMPVGAGQLPPMSAGIGQGPPMPVGAGQGPSMSTGAGQLPPMSAGAGQGTPMSAGAGQGTPMSTGAGHLPYMSAGARQGPPMSTGVGQLPLMSAGQRPPMSVGGGHGPLMPVGSGNASPMSVGARQGPPMSAGAGHLPPTSVGAGQRPTTSVGAVQGSSMPARSSQGHFESHGHIPPMAATHAVTGSSAPPVGVSGSFPGQGCPPLRPHHPGGGPPPATQLAVRPVAPPTSMGRPSQFSDPQMNGPGVPSQGLLQNGPSQPPGGPPQLGPPQWSNGAPSSPYGRPPIPNTLHVQPQGASNPSLLDLPPPGNYHAWSSPQVAAATPGSSAPPSAKSSGNPSPIPTPKVDYMEGQFPSSMTPVGSASNLQALGKSQVDGYPGLGQMSLPPTCHTSSSQFGSASYPASQPPTVSDSITATPLNNNVPGQAMSRRYPQQNVYPSQPPANNWNSYSNNVDGVGQRLGGLSVTNTGFNKIWGTEACDLLHDRNVLPQDVIEPPKVKLRHEYMNAANCSPEIFRCTLTKIPESSSLLQKSKLPLGIVIHPFKDLSHLPVIQCSTIVRCRSCRTYINPFVYFIDQRRWKCNLCCRANELPEEFQYDPVSRMYGDPTRRPEIKSATIEFIAPSEYMLRPPQPAVYLYVLDVSRNAIETGYLKVFCDTLLDELVKLPGDSRTHIGFITFDRTVHFYNLTNGLNQPHQMIVGDIEEIFLPCPDNLLVNLNESIELVKDLLSQLQTRFQSTVESDSALGAALQAAYKLVAPTGGRVTVMQTCLPNIGPSALKSREDPNQRAGKDVPHLGPATDFYKKLALDCSGQQVAVDLFLFNSQYADLATLSGMSKFSGGCMYHFPGFHITNNPLQTDRFEKNLRRYLTRKIGFEAVMRIRCSRGLAIHTFHGNFFVRSTDLLSLPNINPDTGFAMQVSIEESLSDTQNVCFQAALLYTSSKGERRIRVHTLCLPTAASVSDVIHGADQQCIVSLLAKMAVDRSLSSSISDARDALSNVVIDSLSVYKALQKVGQPDSLFVPDALKLLPLYILALLKHTAFRSGLSTKLDDRVFVMCQMKTLPLGDLIQCVYPDLYPVHALNDQGALHKDDVVIPQPPHLQLSSEKLDSHGAYLMDTGEVMYLYVCRGISDHFCQTVLNVSSFGAIPGELYELPELETPESERLRNFINHLQDSKSFPAAFQIIRDDHRNRNSFIERLIEDRNESAFAYYEFLQHLKTQVK